MAVREVLFITNFSVFLIYVIYFIIPPDLLFEEFDCSSTWTAFIVPYRNRSEQLPQFVEAIYKHQQNHNTHVSTVVWNVLSLISKLI